MPRFRRFCAPIRPRLPGLRPPVGSQHPSGRLVRRGGNSVSLAMGYVGCPTMNSFEPRGRRVLLRLSRFAGADKASLEGTDGRRRRLSAGPWGARICRAGGEPDRKGRRSECPACALAPCTASLQGGWLSASPLATKPIDCLPVSGAWLHRGLAHDRPWRSAWSRTTALMKPPKSLV
jgi:hypothetical protein